jgi:DNA polymerase-3 subunit delta
VEGHVKGQFNPATFLIIETGALDKTSSLRRLAEKAPAVAVIPCYDDEPGEIARLIREGLARDKVGLDAEALDLLVTRMPHERGVVRQEVERLALWIGPGSGRTVGADALGAFLGVEAQTSLADAASDAFGGRLAAAHAALRRAAAEGEAGAAVVRALSSHAGRLRRAATLVQDGMGLPEAIKAVGVFWKTEREFTRQARVWSLERLDTLSSDLLVAERACKTTGSPDSLIAERMALAVASQAARLGL